MNISVKSTYALDAVFDLATQAAGQPVKIGAISKRQNIPQKFLELILAGLKQGGFVESRRGAEGGYLLARSPEAITVGDVLRYVEAPQQQARGHDRHNEDSPFGEMWRRVDEDVSRILDRTTFADLARKWTEKKTRFVPNWEI